MNKKMMMWACVLPLLAACQQNENEPESVDEAVMSLQASVSSPVISRTVTDAEDASTDFETGDRIGFFMPGEDSPVEWTLGSDGWTSETPLVWENKVDEFEFCAYYPCTEETAVRTAIPMPDLSAQKGDFSELGTYDFLAARRVTGYSENAGAVSFVGDDAFRHVYSLLSITVKKDKSEEVVHISKVVLRGSGLFSTSEYHFGETSEGDGMTATGGSSVDELAIEYAEPEEVVSETGFSFTLVCNPTELAVNPELEISYERDGIPYTASTTKLDKVFTAGVYNKYVLKLTKEGLKIVGYDVTGWNKNELPEIAVEETPVE